MSVDAGDVIANALLASNIIQDVKIENTDAASAVCERKLFSFNCESEDGQVFYITEDPPVGDLGPNGWSKSLPDSLGECDLGIFGDGFQLCYVDVVPPSVNSYEEVASIAISKHLATASETDPQDKKSCVLGFNACGPAVESAHSGSGPARWSQRQTTLFLTLLKRFESEFLCRLRPKCSILNSIAGIMSATYSDVDKDLCYKKWSNLLRTYRTCKRNNKRGWLYFDDMDRLSASVGTRGMTVKDIQERDRKIKFAKSSIRVFMDKTEDIQKKVHQHILNFQDELHKLQKQSDDHLKNIFKIVEDNMSGVEIESDIEEAMNMVTVPSESSSQSMCESDDDYIVIVPESDAVRARSQVQLLRSTHSPPRSTGYGLFDFTTEIEIPNLCEAASNDSLESDVRPAGPGDSDTGSNNIESTHQLENSGSAVGKLDGQVEYIMPMSNEHSWDSLNINTQDISAVISPPPSLIPINAPSIEINEPVQLVPHLDGTFHFVSLPDQTQNPVIEHSHLFGSLKKMTFTTGSEGQNESNETRNYAELEAEQLERGCSIETVTNGIEHTSESELVILSRSQLDNMNSIVPLETTAVSLQLLPCSDDTFKLVVCPRDNNTGEGNQRDTSMPCPSSGSGSGSGNRTKNPESWSLSIFTPICPVVHVQSPAEYNGNNDTEGYTHANSGANQVSHQCQKIDIAKD